ncbi:MAG: alpha-amylase/4-alpha-glucanotransferase domain-containing protein [bacterium]
MRKKIKFIFGFHNHQPVGNFEHVLENGYQKAYQPLVETFLKHEQMKITWHFTGFLYDWLNQHHPEMNDQLKLMVDRGQAEMMTGGYYEPILSVIPEHDRQGQIRKLTEYVKQHTGYQPTGAWLAERVWEPQLAGTFVDAGIKYTVTDDSHFLSAGLAESETWGYYLTEELGKTLAIFPINQLLRYTIPFQEPYKTIEVFKQVNDQPGEHVLVMADDGEKFGIWPGTYEHCHVKGWLHRFLEEIEKNLDWIEPMTFTECLQTTAPLGRIYLPTASYTEMMEWAMPTSAILQYEQLVEDLETQNKYQPNKHFIRGGFWRNFLVKYPESNNLHKKMLYVSNKIQQMVNQKQGLKSKPSATGSPKSALQKAQDALWAGQTNCAYWHGLFGGLYLNYLRDALYRSMIQAEQLVDQVQHKTQSWIEVDQLDFDADGHQEILVNTPNLSLYFKPSYGGALFECDVKQINFNILDTLSRKKEAYHAKIVEAELQSDTDSDQQEMKSIHDLVITKEPHLEKYLYYDWYQRYSFLDHFMPIDASLEEFSQSKYAELGDFVNQPYQVNIPNIESQSPNTNLELKRSGYVWYEGKQEPMLVTKRFLIPKDTATVTTEYTIQNLSQKKLKVKFGIELNLGLLAGNAPDRYYYFTGNQITDKHLNSIGSVNQVSEMGLVDEWQQLDINLQFDTPAEVWRFPIETVSKSEAGFERVYQHSVVYPNWILNLDPGQSWQMQIIQQIKVSH